MNFNIFGIDVFSEVLQEMQVCFIQCDFECEVCLEWLKMGGFFVVELFEWVEVWLIWLGVLQFEVQVLVQGEVDVKSVVQYLFEDICLIVECVLGVNDLVGVGYFDQVWLCLWVVCWVVICDSWGCIQGFGIGWLCSLQVMVMNYYVLEDVQMVW